jgi:hypothetical protein
MQNFIRWVLILSIMILLADRLFVEMIKLIWRHYGRSWPLWWGFYGNSKSEQTRRLGSVKGPVVYTSKRKPAPVSHPRKPALLTCPFWLLSFKCWHSEGTWTELCGFGTLLCSPRKWVQWERKLYTQNWGFRELVCEDAGLPSRVAILWHSGWEQQGSTGPTVCLEHVREDLDTKIRCCNCLRPGGLCSNALLGRHKCLKKKITGCEHFVCLLQLCACLLPVAKVCNCLRPGIRELCIFPGDVPGLSSHSWREHTDWLY